MTNRLSILTAQLNPVVGDISGNMAMAEAAYAEAQANGADLLVLPELFLIGYPPEDLVFHILLSCIMRNDKFLSYRRRMQR